MLAGYLKGFANLFLSKFHWTEGVVKPQTKTLLTF